MKLLIPTFTTLELIDSHDIITLSADDSYSKIVISDGAEISSNKSLGNYVEELSDFAFFQCHKLHLINISKLVRYHKNGHAEMEGGRMVPVARRRKEELLALLKFEMAFKPIRPHTQTQDC